MHIVLTTSPSPKPRRLASRSPSVVPAVRAATMVSQYQGLRHFAEPVGHEPRHEKNDDEHQRTVAQAERSFLGDPISGRSPESASGQAS